MKEQEATPRQLLANTLADLSGFAPMMSECEKFGMTWGCQPDCPVFEMGKCEIQEENEELFNKDRPITPNKWKR